MISQHPYLTPVATDPGCRKRPARSLARMFTEFGRSCDGVAAIEFGLVLPIMLTIYVGMAECTQAVTNWRKVTMLARAVADLTSQGDQQNPMSTGVTNDILSAAGTILKPFNAANARITVSAMAVDTLPLSGPPRVCSSYPVGTARPVGAAADLTVPNGFRPTSGDVLLLNGARYILAEVSMTYAPMVGAAFVKFVRGSNTPITLTASVAWPVRGGQIYAPSLVPEVVLPGGAKC